MTQTDLFYGVIFTLMLLGVWLVHRRTKLSMLRHGWDARQNGLQYNVTWGEDVCHGWLMNFRGEPRP